MNLVKRMIAEAIGTFALVFFSCGVAALTGGSILSMLTIALTFGLVIVAMAYTIGRISGCHINPAVSLGCFLTKRMNLKEFGAYVLAQFVGGVIGGVAIFGIGKIAGYEFYGDACNYAINFAEEELTAGSIIASLLLEIILTCVFVYVVLSVTDSKNESVGKKAGIIIGLTLTLVHLLGILLTGTSVNPARSFATAICDVIFNGGTDAIAQVWMFIVAPFAGGAAAAYLFKFLHKN